ncbi:16S rRNA (uracil(1498)-N(3))-methyltransferase [Branchiibius sp. NY16-3462-2]|uniref:16S rRNA (uracil(1498)-N(3))-methyltransferase n=1 Tax=Branchiibius sp. NY16-3462-2 TaxID=1807500 RepID=UPI00079A4C49|nr:16S rRNA (uracil(1498)-N(3))-methyltransferase [Branchiibius sp. NY16-3462-2]KYH43762.1 16S rRNA (uracil(1498)-N(3))-methyltransferase [Branchiibius sp. NY16-3462-2]
MTAPLFFTDDLAGARVDDLVRLVGDEGRHAAIVRRLGVGEPIQLADGSGLVVAGLVETVDGPSLQVRIAQVRREPASAPAFTLVQALAKGDRDDQAIEAATELGVDAIVPWQADRSIVQWRGPRGDRALAKWRGVVRAAAKQSRRATIPVVEAPLDSKGLARRTSMGRLTLVLHEEATTPISSVDLPADGEVLVVVGPEGGISPTEVQALIDAGATSVRLGDTVLRSSSAGPAALAVLLARTRWNAPEPIE